MIPTLFSVTTYRIDCVMSYTHGHVLSLSSSPTFGVVHKLRFKSSTKSVVWHYNESHCGTESHGKPLQPRNMGWLDLPRGRHHTSLSPNAAQKFGAENSLRTHRISKKRGNFRFRVSVPSTQHFEARRLQELIWTPPTLVSHGAHTIVMS